MSQKIKMDFAKHRSNGFVVDLVCKGLDFSVESISGVVRKDWERLKKEDEITSEHYTIILNKVCEAVVGELFSLDKEKSNESDKQIQFFNSLVKEFLRYYNQYKSCVETLGAGQKQLDFIAISVFFIPFVAHAISHNTTIEPFIIDRILSSSSKTAVENVFEFIDYKLTQQNPPKNLKECLRNILNPEYEKRQRKEGKEIHNTPYKNINRWLNDKKLPSLEYIKQIAKIGEHCENLSYRQIEVLLKFARIIQYLYNKAKDYFGEDLANLLVEHFRLISAINFIKIYTTISTRNDDIFEIMINEMCKKLPESISMLLHNYLNYYYFNPLFDFFLHKHIEMQGIYSEELKQQEKKYFANIEKFIGLTTQINETNFFEKIDFFLPVLHFVPKNPNDFDIKDWQKYFETRRESFLNPYKDEVKIPNNEELTNMLNKDFIHYAELTKDLLPLTFPQRQKQAGDEIKFKEILQQIQEKYDISEDPYICFMQARFYAQKLDLLKANEFYLKALEYGKNVVGENIKSVIQEGLVVSAQLALKDSVGLKQGKSYFTKFYKEAVFLQLIGEHDIERYSRHFLRDEQKKFDKVFKHLFVSTQEQSSKQADKKQTRIHKQLLENKARGYIHPNLNVADCKEIEKIKLDLTKPDKWIDKPYTNPITQLMHFCLLQDIESVKKLLEAGADVNILKKSDNASVLHYCISEPPFHTTAQQIELAKFLIPKCSVERLNARLVKKKETILSHCIAQGLVELVELLIDNRANFTSPWCSMDDLTPLYWCLQQIAFAKGYLPQIFHEMNVIKESQIKAIMRLHSNATFDDDLLKEWGKRRQTFAQNPKIVQDVNSAFASFYKENLYNYYKIFDLLVCKLDKQGINAIQTNGFTPLIFAAQIDESNLVKKLLDKGADKMITLNSKETAYTYAELNRNLELMILLRH